MDDNLGQAFSMAGMALLFVVAISYAFISYNSLMDRAELFTETNLIGTRSSVAKENIDSTYEKREATRAEVIMAIAGIGRLNSSNERNNYTVEIAYNKKTSYFYSYEEKKIIFRRNNTEVTNYDFDTQISKLITDLKRLIPNSSTTFSVNYTNDTIKYELLRFMIKQTIKNFLYSLL